MHTWLLAHKQNHKIEINEPNSRVLQIQGPNSYKILNQLTEGEIDSKFSYFSAGFLRLIHNSFIYQELVGLVNWVMRFILFAKKQIIKNYGVIF